MLRFKVNVCLKPQPELYAAVKVSAQRKRPQFATVAVAGKQVAVKGKLR
jgi:hypothetical protein